MSNMGVASGEGLRNSHRGRGEEAGMQAKKYKVRGI